MCRKRSFTIVCFYIGIVLLAIQFLVAAVLLYILERSKVRTYSMGPSQCLENINEDSKLLSKTSSEMSFNFYLLDDELLTLKTSPMLNKTIRCIDCFMCKSVVLGLDFSIVSERNNQLLERLIDADFVPVTFYNTQPVHMITQLDHVETAIVLQRKSVFHIVVLHPREDNSWWFGDLHSDPAYEVKLASLNLSRLHLQRMQFEGLIERFETTVDEESNYLLPKDVKNFLKNVEHSKFVECNSSRAAEFRRKFHPDKSPQAQRFRHRVWKILSRVKTVLESLNVVFWLSSGTLLGYFRECDIIAHSKDVDIGIWASSYSENIVSEMQNHGFHLKISLGLPNDSLELSFLDDSGVKLDIFFFYKEDNYYWNGGTQVKSGRKFKYTFPKFTLCWTLFKDLRVRVPCETEAYIRSNYGPNWFTPVKRWDWKTSPFNVKPNGVWTREQLSSAIKIYL